MTPGETGILGHSMTAAPPSPTVIPLARPDIGPRELELVTQVLRSDVLAMGPFTERFEAGIAALAGRREGVACSSGTAGLHMGVRALEIGDGDEVITTPFSFVASANCLLYERAVPRFVDIEEDSLGLDPDLVEHAAHGSDAGGPAGPRVRSSVPDRGDRGQSPGGAAGRSSRTPARGWARRVGGRPLGSFGDVAVFAFYPNKQITTGEGGMVVTDDAALAETHAQPPQPGPRRGRDLAPPRPPGLQLPARRDVRRPRRRPARAARRAARGTGTRRGGLRARARRPRLAPPPTGRRPARRSTGSSTWSGSTRRSTATASSAAWPRSACRRDRTSRRIHLQPFYRARSASSRATSRSPSGSPPRRWPCRSRPA